MLTSLLATPGGVTLADGVQRVPDEVFIAYNVSWLEMWRAAHLPALQKQGGDVMLMLVVFGPREDCETLALLDKSRLNGYRRETEPRFRICRLSGVRPTQLAACRPVHATKAIALLRRCWSMVETAPSGAQEINAAAGDNEIWYLLARRVDDKCIARSKLHTAQGINPPEGGMLRTLKREIEECTSATASETGIP
jgi:hypothetical protein